MAREVTLTVTDEVYAFFEAEAKEDEVSVEEYLADELEMIVHNQTSEEGEEDEPQPAE